MIKQLRKVGNSNAILLDKPLLELVGLKEDGTVEITVDHGSIILTPVNPASVPADRAAELLDKIVETRRRALERLAE